MAVLELLLWAAFPCCSPWIRRDLALSSGMPAVLQMSVQRVCTHTWYLDHGIQPLANTDMGLLPAPLGVLPLPCTTCPGENFFLVSKLQLEAAALCAQSLWHAPPGHPAQIPCSLAFPLKPPRTPCLQCSWQGTIGPCSGSRNSAGVPGGAEPQGAAAGVRRAPGELHVASVMG